LARGRSRSLSPGARSTWVGELRDGTSGHLLPTRARRIGGRIAPSMPAAHVDGRTLAARTYIRGECAPVVRRSAASIAERLQLLGGCVSNPGAAACMTRCTGRTISAPGSRTAGHVPISGRCALSCGESAHRRRPGRAPADAKPIGI
jgi:hypothetical protein